MSRAKRLEKRLNNLDTNPHYGVYNAYIVRISNYIITLKDIFSSYEFDISFNLVDEYEYTQAGKPIYINQYGNIGYGSEELLFESFKKTKYWQARKGEKHLFSFLKALHNPNIFDPNVNLQKNNDYIHNPSSFKQLFLSDYEYNPTIGGLLYLDDDYCQQILNKYIPGNKTSIIRNCKGDFSKINDFSLTDFVNTFINNYNPSGIYRYDYIVNFNDEPIIKNIKDGEF